MKVRELANGIEIPMIGLGTCGDGNCSPEQVSEAVYGAIEAGYRLMDCAAIHGNEDKIGDVFERILDEGNITREELFVTSKVSNDMYSKGDVLLSCAKTLRDLKLDYLDMYFMHWPFAKNNPFEKDEFIAVWRQMEKLMYMGLVHNIGMSNMTIYKLEAILPHCRIRPAALQMELHPAFQQPELFDYCLDRFIQPIGICPVGSTNHPDVTKTDDDISATEMLEVIEIAAHHNTSPEIICLKWAAQRGQIPIPFSVNQEELTSYLRCIDEAPLSDEELDRIDAADKNCRLIKGQEMLWEDADDWREIWDEES